jgi:hypothetical protein
MKSFTLSMMIVQLGQDLKSSVARERLASGITIINDMDIRDFDEKRFVTIAIPMFTRTVYDGHRFNIPVDDYVSHIGEVVHEVFDPAGPDMTLLKDGRTLPYDEEADYMADLCGQFMIYIDTILPEA